MAVSIVQLCGQFSSTASTTTNICTITNTPTVGNHLLLLAGRGVDNATVASVADSAGNTWQVDKTAGGATVTTVGIGLCSARVVNALTGGSSTITTTFSATGTRKIVYIIEVAGLATTSWFGSATALFEQSPNVTTRTTSNSLAPATTGDLIVGCWALPATETGFTSTSPMTAWPAGTAAGYFNAGSSVAVNANYLVTTGTSAQTPAATGARSSTYIGFAATYKQPSSAVPRHPALNFQDPGLLMRAWNANWRPRRSGLIVPTPGIARI